MHIFKKKKFLDRNSANDISELIVHILMSNRSVDEGSCLFGRRINLVVLITDILVYQRDKEKINLTEKNFESILELEYLNTLANDNKIKDINLKKRLEEYLIYIPGNKNSKTLKFEHCEISKEHYEYVASEIKKTIPVIKLLNSKNF